MKALQPYEGKTVVVTGGRGYIGAALTDALTHVRCRLTLVDRSPQDAWRPSDRAADVSIVQSDVSTRMAWEGLLPGADYVFHLAGRDYDRRPDADPVADFEANALPVIHLVEVCRARNLRPGLVFSSSANVIGSGRTLPVVADQREHPLIPWSAHKLLAEQYLHMYAGRHGIESAVLRVSNVYGPTARQAARSGSAVNRMIIDALAGRPLTLWPNSSCVRDYVFLSDIVAAFLVAGACAPGLSGRSYFVGSGDGVSIADVSGAIAKAVRSRTGRDVPIRSEMNTAMIADEFEMRHFVADNSPFRAATGWRPLVSVVPGIGRTVDAFLGADITRAAHTGVPTR